MPPQIHISRSDPCHDPCQPLSLTARRIRRGVFHSVPELIDVIYKYLDAYNEDPNPLVWTAKVEDILRKVSKCKAILQTVH